MNPLSAFTSSRRSDGRHLLAHELTHTVRFEVRAGEAELLSAQEISGTRTYSFDETKLLAKENEEAILRRALAGDLASIVMRRLSSL